MLTFEFIHSPAAVPKNRMGCCDAQPDPNNPRVVVYRFQSVSAGHWIGFGDLEFRADERLSGDEVAQAIWALSGGVPDQVDGQLGGYRVEYSGAQPAQLTLVQMTETGTQAVPRMYYCV